MDAVIEAESSLGTTIACDALDVSRATFYRAKRPFIGPRKRKCHPRNLSANEKTTVMERLHSPEFVDKAPEEIVAMLLDRGQYVCSARTMYRLLKQHNEVRERRNQLRHPIYQRPELLAEKPNELWSWDITKLRGPEKGVYYYLYVIIDVFSRYVVGWLVADCEKDGLAKDLIEQTCKRQMIHANQLTLHSDRGASMTSRLVVHLLADLGVTKSHSRPHVSDDNPYSESAFKTLKYMPTFPERFGSMEDARRHCGLFVRWYNEKHCHSGIAMLTPHDVHYGHAPERLKERTNTLQKAYESHPERFVHGRPKAESLPTQVWINKPNLNSSLKNEGESACLDVPPSPVSESPPEAPLSHRPGETEAVARSEGQLGPRSSPEPRAAREHGEDCEKARLTVASTMASSVTPVGLEIVGTETKCLEQKPIKMVKRTGRSHQQTNLAP